MTEKSLLGMIENAIIGKTKLIFTKILKSATISIAKPVGTKTKTNQLTQKLIKSV